MSEASATMQYSMWAVVLAYCSSKLLSLGLAWISGYVAEVHMNEKFQRVTYLQQQSAPSLSSMAGALVSSYFLMMLLLAAVISISMWIASNSTIEILIVSIWLIFDACIATATISALGFTVTKEVQERRYFNYQTEGLRAIRSVRHILVNTLLIVTLIPFASMLTMQSTSRVVSKLQNSKAGLKLFKRRGIDHASTPVTLAESTAVAGSS